MFVLKFGGFQFTFFMGAEPGVRYWAEPIKNPRNQTILNTHRQNQPPPAKEGVIQTSQVWLVLSPPPRTLNKNTKTLKQ